MINPRSHLFVLLFVTFICFPCFFQSEARNSRKHGRHGNKVKESSFPDPTTANAQQQVLNVESFGAIADQKTDNFQAFKNAWDKACNSLGTSTILVPRGKTYLVKHINFTGPCRSGISMDIQGTIKAIPQMYDVPRRLWIKVEDVRNLDIFGGGTIDGNGQVWWNFSCKIKKTKPCLTQSAPTALTFQNCTNLRVNKLNIVNAQQMHLNIQDSHGVEVSGLEVSAPEESPNTDGIHITRSTNIAILDSVIKTGDDCVSIVNGTRNVQVRNIQCGPGHGISIGSLGEDGYENHVSDILVKNVMLTKTTNGVRIKTWQGGKGTASNIIFEDIFMKNVANPITINQNYCDKGKTKQCQKEKDAVAVENIVYRNISGTSISKVGVNLNCSESVPCKNVMLENVNIRPAAAQSSNLKNVEAFCRNIMSQPVQSNSFPNCPN